MSRSGAQGHCLWRAQPVRGVIGHAKLHRVMKTVLPAVVCLLLVAACSSDGKSDGAGPGGSTDGGAEPARLGLPPAKPDAPKTTSSTAMNFAVKKIRFGDLDESGNASADAWRTIGFNLDGKVSTRSSTDVCKNPGGSPGVHENGKDGIDNSFGANIVQTLATLRPSFSKDVNDYITAGNFTVMLDVKGLTGADQTNTGVSANSFAGGKFSTDAAKKPSFTPGDDWPVLTSGGNIAPLAAFDDGYVVNGRWVSQSDSAKVAMTLFGVPLSVNFHHAVITFQHDGHGRATGGILAGIIVGDELLDELKKIAGHISSSLCGSGFDTVATVVRGAMDIMADGSNASGKTCDGLSGAVAFEAAQIGPPTTAAPTPTAAADACTP